MPKGAKNESISALLKEAFQDDLIYEFAGNFKLFSSSGPTLQSQETLLEVAAELTTSSRIEPNWKFSKILKSIEISTKSSKIFKARGLLRDAQFSAETVSNAVKSVQGHTKDLDNTMVDAAVLEIISGGSDLAGELAFKGSNQAFDDDLEAIHHDDDHKEILEATSAVQVHLNECQAHQHDQDELVYLCYALGMPIFDREFLVLETRRKLSVELLEKATGKLVNATCYIICVKSVEDERVDVPKVFSRVR